MVVVTQNKKVIMTQNFMLMELKSTVWNKLIFLARLVTTIKLNGYNYSA